MKNVKLIFSSLLICVLLASPASGKTTLKIATLAPENSAAAAAPADADAVQNAREDFR